MKKTIFEKLNDANICYAVGVAVTEFKIKCEIFGRDYHLIVAKTDEQQLEKIGLKFYDSSDENYDTMERTLNDEEINIFKSIQNDFIRATQNKNGRVYELKNNGFKKYYTKLIAETKNNIIAMKSKAKP